MWKRIKQWAYWMAVVGLYMTMSPDLALACERCFGASVDSPTTQGIQMAMLTLLGSVGLAGHVCADCGIPNGGPGAPGQALGSAAPEFGLRFGGPEACERRRQAAPHPELLLAVAHRGPGAARNPAGNGRSARGAEMAQRRPGPRQEDCRNPGPAGSHGGWLGAARHPRNRRTGPNCSRATFRTLPCSTAASATPTAILQRAWPADRRCISGLRPS